ncbi:hypothetical protein WQ64_26465 [Escherichia coli]|nr:hypothetical protein WQ64_26465 [Escherichia coli]
MLPSETMIWQPEFTDKTLSRKPGAVHWRYISRYRGLSSHTTDTWCNKTLQAMPWSRAYHRHISVCAETPAP